MRQVAEIIYVVESEREEFLKGALAPDEETKKILWLCGVRKQQYYLLNDLIFMTFEYKGENFKEDMERMAAYLESKGHLVKMRRKDVPVEERNKTSWWAPVKKLGSILEEKPDFGADKDDVMQEDYLAILDGCMHDKAAYNDIAFDEDEWMESIHIWKN